MNRLALTVVAAFVLIGLVWAMTITPRVADSKAEAAAGIGLPP